MDHLQFAAQGQKANGFLTWNLWGNPLTLSRRILHLNRHTTRARSLKGIDICFLNHINAHNYFTNWRACCFPCTHHLMVIISHVWKGYKLSIFYLHIYSYLYVYMNMSICACICHTAWFICTGTVASPQNGSRKHTTWQKEPTVAMMSLKWLIRVRTMVLVLCNNRYLRVLHTTY